MELLEGEEKSEEGRKETQQEEEEDKREEAGLEEEELRKMVGNMRKKKAAGIDGIPMEVWKFAGGVWKKLVKLINRIWKERTILEDWKTSIVVPSYKKGNQEEAINYRDTSLVCSAYKIYTEVIRRRLENEVERKKLLSEN